MPAPSDPENARLLRAIWAYTGLSQREFVTRTAAITKAGTMRGWLSKARTAAPDSRTLAAIARVCEMPPWFRNAIESGAAGGDADATPATVQLLEERFEDIRDKLKNEILAELIKARDEGAIETVRPPDLERPPQVPRRDHDERSQTG